MIMCVGEDPGWLEEEPGAEGARTKTMHGVRMNRMCTFIFWHVGHSRYSDRMSTTGQKELGCLQLGVTGNSEALHSSMQDGAWVRRLEWLCWVVVLGGVGWWLCWVRRLEWWWFCTVAFRMELGVLATVKFCTVACRKEVAEDMGAHATITCALEYECASDIRCRQRDLARVFTHVGDVPGLRGHHGCEHGRWGGSKALAPVAAPVHAPLA